MASRPAQAAALMDELVEEILLRIPPDDPAHLLHAALVCKRWCRIVSDPGFRRRFREFHRTPPILGFLCSRGPWTSYVPSTFFRPSPARLNYRAVDARHGRVLLHGVSWNHERKHWDDSFMVWDPITGGERARLPLLPRSRHQESNSTSGTWNAAVLCASAAVDDAYDHLDCHSGPFLVVFVARGRRWGRSGMCAHVYSSEAAAWSQRIYAPHLAEHMQLVPSPLAGNSMYFLCSKSVLKFDLITREMSLIDLPQETFGRAMPRTTEDSALGLASMCSDGLHLWSMEVGPTEVVGWAHSKVIKLTELPPADPIGSLLLTGFAHGLGVILVCTSEGIFTIDLESVRVIKHWERLPLPSDQEQASQMSDEHKILHCAALSVKAESELLLRSFTNHQSPRAPPLTDPRSALLCSDPIRGEQHGSAAAAGGADGRARGGDPPPRPAGRPHAPPPRRARLQALVPHRLRRRFREFHRTPPILGFLHNHRLSYSFAPTSSFRPHPAARPNSYRAIDARHGRVLLWCHRFYRNTLAIAFVVWDPITGESAKLPLLPLASDTWNAAVLCAASAVGACDHLDCQHGPFLVVFVGMGKGNGGFARVYSSEAATWSKRISAQHLREDIHSLPSALAGNALCFVCSTIILKYDLAAQEMSVIHLPRECFFRPTIVGTTEDGRLGLASIRSHRLYLHLWSIEDAGWVQSKVIKLTKLLPDEPLGSLRLTGFAHGLDIILVAASEGTFTIDLKSVRVTKVCEEGRCYDIFPYTSFCNPALGAASSAE